MSKQKLFANKTRPKKYIWSKFLKVYRKQEYNKIKNERLYIKLNRKQKYPEHKQHIKQERKNPYK